MAAKRPVIVDHVPKETAPLEDRVLLTEIVRALVARPAQVAVSEVVLDSQQAVLRISCALSDKGQVVGSGGETINALRRIFKVIGSRDRRTLAVEMAD